MDDSVSTCDDKVIDAEPEAQSNYKTEANDKETKAFRTNFNEKL